MKYDHIYSREDKEAMTEVIQDQHDEWVDKHHYPVDDGYCSCGVLCETGTRFAAHIAELKKRK